VNSPSGRKQQWKADVSTAAAAVLAATVPPWTWPPGPLYAGDVVAKVWYFPPTAQYIDVDNGLKYTIDGLCPPLWDDKTVMRVIAERVVAPVANAALLAPIGLAATLLNAMQAAVGGPGVAGVHATAVKVEAHVPAPVGLLW
jgi:hypothetical protein